MARGVLLGLLLSGLLAAGCASVPTADPRHYLLVHADGYPLKPDETLPAQKGFDEYVKAVIGAIDQYVEKYNPHEWPGKRPRPQLVLFIHGGLSPHRKGVERVQEFLDAQQPRHRDGTPHHPEIAASHFVFLNWDSDLWGSLLDDVCCIRRGERDPGVGVLTAPFVTLARVAEGVFLAPRAWAYQTENAIDGFREEAERDRCNPSESEPLEETPLNVPAIISFAAFYPIRLLSVPFIQSFGTSAWEMMKRRAELVFARKKALPKKEWVKEGAGRLLMHPLQPRLKTAGMWTFENGSTKELDVVLVGFSMGAFLVNRLLQEYADIHFSRILYLGAASSINDFEASAIPYLRQHKPTKELKGAKFWSFSIAEADEAQQISYLDVYERGSLLVWIDNYFERINVPTQRTFGRWKNLRLYFKIPDEFDPKKGGTLQMFLVKFDGRGWRDPREHGEFDNPKIFNRLLEMSEQDCPSGKGTLPLRFLRPKP